MQPLRLGRSILLVLGLAGLFGCEAPNYVAKGPPGPSPDATIAIYEATLRYYFRPTAQSNGPPKPQLIAFKSDLDDGHRAELITRLNDLPIDLQPPDPMSNTSPRGWRRFSIATTWMNEDRARLRIGNYYGSQGTVEEVTADYQEGVWRFRSAKYIAVVN